jgi:hypothetical protein
MSGGGDKSSLSSSSAGEWTLKGSSLAFFFTGLALVFIVGLLIGLFLWRRSSKTRALLQGDRKVYVDSKKMLSKGKLPPPPPRGKPPSSAFFSFESYAKNERAKEGSGSSSTNPLHRNRLARNEATL